MAVKVKETVDRIRNSEVAQKSKKFLEDHKNIFQIIKFTLISLIAFIAEFASMYALQYGLAGVYGDQEFRWFLFYYAPGKTGAYGLAGFIAFLGSKCIAEIISFIVNRKKTFEANNNVVFSAIMYVITVIAVILLSTWLGGALGDLLGPSIGADAGNTISKLVGSFLSWVIMFLMDKFVIMRKVDKGEKAEESVTEPAMAVAGGEVLAVEDDSEDAALREHVTAIEEAVEEGLESVGVVPPKFNDADGE